MEATEESQTATLPSSPAFGGAFIVIVVVVLIAGQPPLAGIVYVMVYGPGVLDAGVINPVLELTVKPTVELYVPPV